MIRDIAMVPRGIRNNNPLNIRKNDTNWQGEVQPGTDSAFEQFASMAYGYRAAFVLLSGYNDRGCNNIDKIINRWAPASENNTAAYITHVEAWSGVNRYKMLNKIGSKEDYIKIVAAMSRVENGIEAVMSDVNSGFNMQTKLM